MFSSLKIKMAKDFFLMIFEYGQMGKKRFKKSVSKVIFVKNRVNIYNFYYLKPIFTIVVRFTSIYPFYLYLPI
jgi:hypothetical protein